MAQVEPDRLVCQGRTAGEPNRTYTIRTPFDGTVVKVHVSDGKLVKVGDSLVEIFSSDLFEAQDQLLDPEGGVGPQRRGSQHPQGGVPARPGQPGPRGRLRGDEKARLEFEAAEDKLRVLFGLPDDEIRIGGRETATLGRLTLRSPADGLVTGVEAVTRNRYDKTAVLMTVASLDRLQVQADIPEADRTGSGPGWPSRSGSRSSD